MPTTAPTTPAATAHTGQTATAQDAALRTTARRVLALDDGALFASASALREQAFGRKVELCAIINARSGHCPMNCAFCSQSAYHSATAPVFDLLDPAELRERMAQLASLPLRHVGLVTSGGALPPQEVARLADTVAALPEHWRGRVCASLGRLPQASQDLLRTAGFARLHHNLETSRAHYPRICTTQTWDERRDTVVRAQRSGLSVCCGGIFGIGESWDDRVDFACSLRQLGVDNVPINFLYPHKGTPLAEQPPLEAREALRIIALFRHLLPTATLRVCGGRPLVLGARQKDIFAAGANALMTGDYLTTHGKALDDDCRMITQAGMEISV